MTFLQQLLRTGTIWAAALLAACSGGDASTRAVAVNHVASDFPTETRHVEYFTLTEAGEWITLGREFGLNGRNLAEVPTGTKVLLVRAHSQEHEVLNERIYLVSADDEAATPSSHSRWMTQDEAIQASTLFKITIPGAHDAGMGKVNTCSFYANGKTTQTQSTSIAQMLDNGIRYFDLRPMFVKYDDEMRLGHYSWVGKTINLGIYEFTLRNEGCTGYTVATALQDVRQFMAGSDNREVVILKMSHFQNLKVHDNSSSHFDPADFAELQRMISEALGPYLLIGDRDFRHTPISELTASGPKVIVTFDAPDYDGSSGIHPQSDLILYDNYANESSYGAMKDDQFGKMASYASPMENGSQYWETLFGCRNFVGPMSAQCYKRAESAYMNLQPYFVLSWTLTQSQNQMIACSVAVTDVLRQIAAGLGYSCKTLTELGKEANSHLAAVIAEAKAKRRYPNVLYVDQADGQATTAAIAINAMH